MKPWPVLLLVAVALAGCSDDEPVDPASQCDPETNYLNEMDECLPHVEPSIVVTGMPETLQVYDTADFNWSLDPGTRALDGTTVHSMDSRIKASMSTDVPNNATGPDAWGTEIAREQHKDLPQNFSTSIDWEDIGTLYVYGYMLINGQNLWYDLGSIEITAVEATGEYTDVNIDNAQQSSIAPVGITVGDGVRFNNNQQFGYTLSFSGNGCPDGGSIGAGQSLEVDFLEPVSCDYTLNTPLNQGGTDPGRITGRVNVNTP